MSEKQTNESSIQRVKLLSYGGLIPFFLTFACIYFTTGNIQAFSIKAFIAYAAIIFSFVGAVHWGFVLQNKTDDSNLLLTISSLSSLIGWVALLIPNTFGLLLLAIAFPTLHAYERFTSLKHIMPRWYMSMRLNLTIAVTLLILLSLIKIF